MRRRELARHDPGVLRRSCQSGQQGGQSGQHGNQPGQPGQSGQKGQGGQQSLCWLDRAGGVAAVREKLLDLVADIDHVEMQVALGAIVKRVGTAVAITNTHSILTFHFSPLFMKTPWRARKRSNRISP